MKNVVGLNVHQVSSCWEHAKGLTTMVFLVCAAMLLILFFSLASSQLNFFVLRSRKDGLGFFQWVGLLGLFWGWLGCFPLF